MRKREILIPVSKRVDGQFQNPEAIFTGRIRGKEKQIDREGQVERDAERKKR